MKCPKCKKDTSVIERRYDHRRRKCKNCDYVFYTIEKLNDDNGEGLREARRIAEKTAFLKKKI
jgi:transcriptional regulator NrdR family protein